MSPAKHVDINRDEDNDILYVLRRGADPEQTVNVDINENVVLRADAKTNQVVGFIIDDFTLACPKWKNLSEYELMEKFDALIEGINNLHLQVSPSNS